MSDFSEARGAPEPAEPPARHVIVSPEAREEIEGVLSAFRQWLLESEQWRTAIPVPAEGPEEAGAAADLHTLLGEWIALKQEFRLEARGGKASREQLDQAAGEFQQGLSRLHEEVRELLEPLMRERDRLRDEMQAQVESRERGWVELLLDVREALARGAETSRQASRRLGWRGRLLPRGLFGSLVEGYELALRRMDAALESRNIRPIECEGQRVDPERMRVVDVVYRDDLPGGHVAEVVRCGYVRGDRVIRYAEVRAVAAGPSADESPRAVDEVEAGGSEAGDQGPACEEDFRAQDS